MKPTEQLKAEHEGITLILNILNKVYDQLKSTQELNKENFTKILEFLKIFIDKCHHGKEEDLLLPAIVKTGVPKDKGIITLILMEHKKGRKYVLGMSKAFDKLKNGDCQASVNILKNIKSYTTLLIQHIDKENTILFPMADKLLSNTTQKEIEEGFERLEVERIGIGKHEEFHKMLHQLKEVYLE